MSSHPDLHAVETAEFGFARFLESLSVVRFDPASQEAGRHRNKEPSVGQLFGFYPGKPAGEKVVPQFSLETFRNTLPALLQIGVHVCCHRLVPCFLFWRRCHPGNSSPSGGPIGAVSSPSAAGKNPGATEN